MKTKQHRFTLIELLVTIAIIALLASFILPNLKKARDAAYKADCINNLHQIALAYQGYLHEEDDFPAFDVNDKGNFSEIKPYLQSNLKVFRCKSNSNYSNISEDDLVGNTAYFRSGPKTESPIQGSISFGFGQSFNTDNDKFIGDGVYDRDHVHNTINWVSIEGGHYLGVEDYSYLENNTFTMTGYTPYY